MSGPLTSPESSHSLPSSLEFYLGSHMPHWLAIQGIPSLFISHRRLANRRTLPRATGSWALDSGGFSELSLYGGWRTTPKEYVAAVRRYDDEIGSLAWAAPQDWMCEPHMLAQTGKSVAEHQRLTIDNFRTITDLWWAGKTGWGPDAWRDWPDMCPFMPVLQGWHLDDYRRHADAYYAVGIELECYPLVGLGSVCRRQNTTGVERLIREFTPWLALHGFGVKTLGLERVGHRLESADSMAWSLNGRHTPGCGSGHRNEANCLQFALRWREKTLARVGVSSDVEQMSLFSGSA